MPSHFERMPSYNSEEDKLDVHSLKPSDRIDENGLDLDPEPTSESENSIWPKERETLYDPDLGHQAATKILNERKWRELEKKNAQQAATPHRTKKLLKKYPSHTEKRNLDVQQKPQETTTPSGEHTIVIDDEFLKNLEEDRQERNKTYGH
jgi:hypothetical protein